MTERNEFLHQEAQRRDAMSYGVRAEEIGSIPGAHQPPQPNTTMEPSKTIAIKAADIIATLSTKDQALFMISLKMNEEADKFIPYMSQKAKLCYIDLLLDTLNEGKRIILQSTESTCKSDSKEDTKG